MSKRIYTLALFLGAVALAFGAYALGARSNSGADAADNPVASGQPSVVASTSAPSAAASGSSTARDCGPRGAGRGLQDLATQLGVSQDKLKAALDAVKSKRSGSARQSLVDALAAELGVSADSVQNALKSARDQAAPGRPWRKPDADALAASLAKSLNLDEAKVKAALDKVRSDAQQRFEQERKQFADDLAQELGLPVDKVEKALSPAKPFFFGRLRHP
jgi:hypothetical protein